MSAFEFDRELDRRPFDSLKWDVAPGELPMWVADMDFETAPAVMEAIARRAAHGTYGYSIVPREWYAAIGQWWQTRHGFFIPAEWLMFCTGVVPAISSAVRKLTTPAEQVVMLTPVYNIFFNSVYNNGRNILPCPLRYENGAYSIDFEDLAKKLADPQTTLMLLCNPHNPIGKIWDRETLARIGALCAEHHVTVLSDEIHCDLTDPGKAYAPFASVNEQCRDISVVCIAPSKTFNLAGLQSAAVYAANPVLRHKINRAINTDEVAEPNAFAVSAATAAYTKGGPWLDALRAYLFENKAIVCTALAKTPLLLVPSEATYLLWIDCTALCGADATAFAAFLRRETGLYCTAGAVYGVGGAPFFRMNIACPRSRVQDGIDRLLRGIAAYQAKA